tara:strand:- start:799 stop:1002 length:204 start_codon:yes stop_codon:yes gene_type:complete
MFYAIYDIKTGVIDKTVDIPEFMSDIITLKENQAKVVIDRIASDTTEYIKDGVLTDKPQSMLDTTTP